eukprot:4806557-Lingulodinium_polyedra.AAC.1
MVVETQTRDGEWPSCTADRLPSQLDDAIKGVKTEFYTAAPSLNSEDIKDELPMGFPMTHVDPDFPCVAKYPVDAWREAGALQ